MAPSQNLTPTLKYLQEEPLTEPFQALLATLPRTPGWVCTHLYQYQGFWHTTRQLQGVLATQAHFQAYDSDILLVTTPKSGTTWLKSLLYALVHRTRHPVPATLQLGHGQNDHPLTSASPHDLVPFLELKVYVDNQVPDLSVLPCPRLFSTHLPIGSLPSSVFESGCKIVYLCRDPKDTFISMWHFANKLRPKELEHLPLEEAFEKFSKGESLYGPFWAHVLGYWKYSLERPNKVHFVTFEDLKENPEVELKKLAVFCGCPFSPEEEAAGVIREIHRLCSFKNLSSLEVNKKGKLSSGEENKLFFRKGEVGDWINYLTPEMIEKLDKISEEKLHRWGVKF